MKPALFKFRTDGIWQKESLINMIFLYTVRSNTAKKSHNACLGSFPSAGIGLIPSWESANPYEYRKYKNPPIRNRRILFWQVWSKKIWVKSESANPFLSKVSIATVLRSVKWQIRNNNMHDSKQDGNDASREISKPQGCQKKIHDRKNCHRPRNKQKALA